MAVKYPPIRLGSAPVVGLSLVLVSTTALASPAVADEAQQQIPVPDVEGPIPGAPPGDPKAEDIEQTYPFFATDVDLDEYNYVEEEFFISGTANQYESGEVASEHPYKTRVVVRRPAEQADSNGDVLMEWQNVSAGYDIDALWSPSPDHIMRSGYTWVGVSAQDVGVSQLTEWSPTRYGDLDVTDGGTVENDRLSFDVFSQAAQAVRTNENDVMGGVEADQVLAIGASQSAGFMTSYYNDILPHIEPVFDGYGYMVGNAPQNVDRPEPVFQVLSETDAARTANPREDTDNFRLWEVAGTAHSGWSGYSARESIETREFDERDEYNCAKPPFSRAPLEHPLNASYDHLSEWASEGDPPPTAERITRTSDGELARDDDGHAKGGIRLSQVEVPTALNTGINSPADADSFFCTLFGSHEPYDEDQLAERYRTKGSYLWKVARTERQNVRDGYVVWADSKENRSEAIKSDVGK